MKFENIDNNPNRVRVILETEEEKAEVNKYAELFCDCKDKDEDDHPRYAEGHMGVNHGWVCNTCDKFVQIG